MLVAQRIFDNLPAKGEYLNPSQRRNGLGEPTTLIIDKKISETTLVVTIKYGRVIGGYPMDCRRLVNVFAKLGAMNGHVPVLDSFKGKPSSGDNNKIDRRPRPGDE